MLWCFIEEHLFFIKVNANDLQPQLTVTLLENQQHDDCQYSGEVLFEADYRLPYADTYILLVTTSIDGDHYSPLARYELEGRRGHLQIPVDAGECLQDIQIAIQTL